MANEFLQLRTNFQAQSNAGAFVMTAELVFLTHSTNYHFSEPVEGQRGIVKTGGIDQIRIIATSSAVQEMISVLTDIQQTLANGDSFFENIRVEAKKAEEQPEPPSTTTP